MGPADPTIVVTSGEAAEEDAGIDVSELLDAVEPYGTVVLVRWEWNYPVTDDNGKVTPRFCLKKEITKLTDIPKLALYLFIPPALFKEILKIL